MKVEEAMIFGHFRTLVLSSDLSIFDCFHYDCTSTDKQQDRAILCVVRQYVTYYVYAPRTRITPTFQGIYQGFRSSLSPRY